jgi:hypothetical protein
MVNGGGKSKGLVCRILCTLFFLFRMSLSKRICHVYIHCFVGRHGVVMWKGMGVGRWCLGSRYTVKK